MKQTIIILISCILSVCLFTSCDKSEDLNQYKVGDFEFRIDSIYNVTQTSVTVKATLYTAQVEKNITGLNIQYFKEGDRYKDYGTKIQSFDQKEGTVLMTITNLEPNTIYYMEPWIEIAYSNNQHVTSVTGLTTPNTEVSFMTHGELPKTGTVNDIEGNMYHYITIGTQTWMVENLKTTHLRSGELIDNLKDSISWATNEYGYCNYNNDSTYSAKYGRIYSRKIANSYIAPGGWHVPTLSDWNLLENYLIANGYNYDKSTDFNRVAKSLASQTSDWKSSYYNIGGITTDLTLNNSTGFTALPGGYRNIHGMYLNEGSSCYFWSSAPYNQPYNGVFLESVFSGIYQSEPSEINGMYIRCIRDNN